jgi:CRISPR-associated endonuclease Csn1
MGVAMKKALPQNDYVLGLDIGANSIGWALLQEEPGSLIDAGVRIFPAGVEGDMASGKDESRAAKRREARLHRRQLDRCRRRLDKVAHLLQQAGLLPAGELETPEQRLDFFAKLEQEIFSKEDREIAPQVLPYRLRARALDEKLAPYELGRALYHLAHRRGFLSNKKEIKKRDDDEGKVKKAIGELAENMEKSGARTLGEFFAKLDPTEERIRGRWTGRKMFEVEFEKIWQAQARYYPKILTEEFKKKLARAIFFQRPLKTQRHLIGQCELEPRCKRAPLAILSAQRFRLLQKVNDLEITTSDGEIRKLDSGERTKLSEELETQGDLTWPKVRKLLGQTGCRFNFETSEEKLIGNRTGAALIKIFGDRWQRLSDSEKEVLVEDIHSIQKEETLRRRGQRKWGLSEEAAEKFAKVRLEEGYCRLSRQALAKVLPLMEKGEPFATARKKIYGAPPPQAQHDTLPLLHETLEVRNPAVERALTQVRRVVNAVVKQYGRPGLIRVELARDLKKNRKDREAISKRNFKNRKAREVAAEQILQQAGITQPKRSEIEKWLLADECGWLCPYTGKTISATNLFGDAPQFDVEHIIPFQRCFDNSFINKTLCHHEENRNCKRNYTPWEAYGPDAARWQEIIGRVKQFTGPVLEAKLAQFQIGAPEGRPLESLEGFSSRQLNDTRYASRLAVEYLALLYGANADGLDAKGKRRIQASRGQVTAYLRGEWELNTILGGGEKTRDDHRQHAIDAAVVALTTPKAIKLLSDAAVRGAKEGRRRFSQFSFPWQTFGKDMNQAITELIVSHCVSRKVAGAMHEETIYSKPFTDTDGKPCVHVRKRIEALSEKNLEDIVDPKIKESVKKKLQELGMKDPSKAFKSRENHPTLKTKNDREIPIHKVRIRVNESTLELGRGKRSRQVKLGSNHHMEILEVKDKQGRPHWEGEVVSTYEAMRRLRNGEPVIRRDHGEGKAFKFSLAQGEIIELNNASENKRELYAVKKVTKRGEGKKSRRTVGIVKISDARESKTRELTEPSAEVLLGQNCRKVVVTPLGEIRRSND